MCVGADVLARPSVLVEGPFVCSVLFAGYCAHHQVLYSPVLFWTTRAHARLTKAVPYARTALHPRRYRLGSCDDRLAFGLAHLPHVPPWLYPAPAAASNKAIVGQRQGRRRRHLEFRGALDRARGHHRHGFDRGRGNRHYRGWPGGQSSGCGSRASSALPRSTPRCSCR